MTRWIYESLNRLIVKWDWMSGCWMDIWMKRWMVNEMDGRSVGWMDRQFDGWMDV